MTIRHAVYSGVVLKADTADGQDQGVFEALVSVFNNVDSHGDMVMPGAYTRTLAEWKGKGDPIPVIWSHQSGDPDSHIGVVLEAKEVPEGLWIKGKIDIDDPDSPRARKVWRLMKGRRVTQFSFAYDIADGGWARVEKDGKSYYELRDLDLFEVGPTLVGANRSTDLLGVKGALCQNCRQEIDSKAKPEPSAPTLTDQSAPERATLSPADALLSLSMVELDTLTT